MTIREPQYYLEVADRYLAAADDEINRGADPESVAGLLRIGQVHIDMAKVSTFAGPYLFKQLSPEPHPKGQEG